MHLKKKQQLERDDGSYGSNMADNAREVRIEEQLKVKIGEAKNLCSRNAANTSCSAQGSRDVYCTLALDQEEICRTPTMERTLSPFFGEEYQFKIPRRFRYLTVYVWDRDRHMKQDKPIGKVAIKREELHKYNNTDHWFTLRPVDADSEVQGMASIEVKFQDMQSSSIRATEFDHRNDAVIEEVGHHQLHHNNHLNNHHHNNHNHNHHHHHHQHQNQAQQNDYKENSELGNIQRGSIKSRLNAADSNGGAWKQHSQQQSIDKPAVVVISVRECIDLAKKNGTCDPFVIFTAYYSNKRQISKRTKVQRKTVSPQFDEEMHFPMVDVDSSTTPKTTVATCHDSSGGGGGVGMHTSMISTMTTSSNKAYTIYPVGGADLLEIVATVWHDASGMSERVFLGEVKIPMHGKQPQVQPLAWYFLQPRSGNAVHASLAPTPRSCATPPGTRLSCDSPNGSLRLKVTYTADHVFPLATYDDLMNLLLQSVDQRPITISAVSILGELVSSKTDVAQPLVRLFTHKGRIAGIIKALADHEISHLTDPTTIFRGNTLVSKMMDEAMRLSGLHYLHQTLRPVLSQILSEKKPCEIDPSKVKDRSAVDTNRHHLEDYVERVFDAITKSAGRCPKVLCQIFHDLRECAGRHFPKNSEVRYSVVSGFIFLRFFAPAILGPRLFDLTTEQLDQQTSRTLTLISKTIQSLGNLVSSRSSQQPCKEEYTGELYKKFCTEKHVAAVKHFLEAISTISSTANDSNSMLPKDAIIEPILLKEGMMTKYPNRKRFGRRPFKQRYFRLTTHSLSYAKSKGKQPICDIPLSEIESVEQLNEKSFKMQNCFKIVRKDRSLIVQTTNCVEEREWIDLLHKICLTNSIRLQYFHPSAFVNGIYSCCMAADENAAGCKNVSPEAMDYFQMDLVTALDPALDLQRIHTLIMTHMSGLEDLSNPSTFRDGMKPLVTMLKQLGATEATEARQVIEQLTQVAFAIDQDHWDYKQGIARKLKYGSRQAPIGDDNYLHMMRTAGQMNIQQHQYQLQQQAKQQQQQLQQQQQSSGQSPQVLPQMQHVMAYPYQQQQQQLQQQQQQHSNMNAYLMHSIPMIPQQHAPAAHHQLQLQQQHHHQHHHVHSQSAPHILRAAATVHSVGAPPPTASSSGMIAAIGGGGGVYMRDAVERFAAN